MPARTDGRELITQQLVLSQTAMSNANVGLIVWRPHYHFSQFYFIVSIYFIRNKIWFGKWSQTLSYKITTREHRDKVGVVDRMIFSFVWRLLKFWSSRVVACSKHRWCIGVFDDNVDRVNRLIRLRGGHWWSVCDLVAVWSRCSIVSRPRVVSYAWCRTGVFHGRRVEC